MCKNLQNIYKKAQSIAQKKNEASFYINSIFLFFDNVNKNLILHKYRVSFD